MQTFCACEHKVKSARKLYVDISVDVWKLCFCTILSLNLSFISFLGWNCRRNPSVGLPNHEIFFTHSRSCLLHFLLYREGTARCSFPRLLGCVLQYVVESHEKVSLENFVMTNEIFNCQPLNLGWAPTLKLFSHAKHLIATGNCLEVLDSQWHRAFCPCSPVRLMVCVLVV